jgi:RimJ/RimL family protein N-acetyltransferase
MSPTITISGNERGMVAACLLEVLYGIPPGLGPRPDRPATVEAFDRLFRRLCKYEAPTEGGARELDGAERVMALYALKTTVAEMDYDAQLQVRTGCDRHELCRLIERVTSEGIAKWRQRWVALAREDLTFESRHLRLRPVDHDDRDDLIALEQDPEVMRYLNGGKPARDGMGHTSEFLMPRGGELDVWAAVDKKEGAFVGWFSLHRTGSGVAELGYRLRREMWGKSLATEGAAALLAAGFDEFGLERIIASTMAVNIASRRVIEKIGMKHVRTIHAVWASPLPGSEQGDFEYAITRDEWKKRPVLGSA